MSPRCYLFRVLIGMRTMMLSSPFNLMTHNAVWRYRPIQKQKESSKKLSEGKLSENGLNRYAKMINSLIHILHALGFPDLI